MFKMMFYVTNGMFMFINFANEMFFHKIGEPSGSVVEYLTRD